VSRDRARDFAAACRMPDVNRILQVEMGRQRGEISCVVIHIVTGTRLRRAAVPPADRAQ